MIPLPVVIDHTGRAPVADGIGQELFQTLPKKAVCLWVKVSGAENARSRGILVSERRTGPIQIPELRRTRETSQGIVPIMMSNAATQE